MRKNNKRDVMASRNETDLRICPESSKVRGEIKPERESHSDQWKQGKESKNDQPDNSAIKLIRIGNANPYYQRKHTH
jgi:hypothetical protein